MALNMPKRQHCGITEAAHIIGRSTDYIRARIADGTLPAFRVNHRGAYAIKLTDLNAMFKPVPTLGYNPKAQALDLAAA